MAPTALGRRMFAEFLGTGLLVTAVVGSGIMATRLSPYDVGLQLLENVFAVAFALAVLILLVGPVSGAHLNPVVTLADWFLGHRDGTGIRGADIAGYVVAETTGAVAGCILANVMFGLAPVTLSGQDRSAGHPLLSELVATAGLIAVIFALRRSGRSALAPATIGAYIAAACWFTSSTSFANPAVTVGRAFSDTFAGIAPGSVPGFIAAQAAGLVAGVVLVLMLYPGGSFGPAPAPALRRGSPVTTSSGGHHDLPHRHQRLRPDRPQLSAAPAGTGPAQRRPAGGRRQRPV